MNGFEQDFAAWDDRLEAYREHLKRRYRNRRPKKSLYGIEKFWSWLRSKEILPTDLDPRHFVEYGEELESGRLCKATERYTTKVLAHLKNQALLWTRHLLRKNELVLDPFASFSPGFGSRTFQTDVLSTERVKAILVSPDGTTPHGLRDRAILEVAYGSGLRLGELADLSLGSLDLNEETLTLRDTKSGWDRVVPLTRPACEALKCYLLDGRHLMSGPLTGSALWLSSLCRPMSYSSFEEIPRRCRRVLGYGFTMHQLRHACATHLLEGGARLIDIARLLGHESLESTQVYARARLERLRLVHEKCHPRG